MTLSGSSGLTAALVSFCDVPRPRSAAEVWFVHSWLTRWLVAEWSGHPLEPVTDGGGTEAACTPAVVLTIRQAAWLLGGPHPLPPPREGGRSSARSLGTLPEIGQKASMARPLPVLRRSEVPSHRWRGSGAGRV